MTSLPPDPYAVLGVTKDAQITEIRSAHRKLVLKCHPDKVQDPELKALKQDEFQKVQQAYELLSDEKERQRYDDQARIAELRKQMQAKANTSSPRATPTTYKFEVRTAEPRPSSYKSTSGTPPSSKGFYPRSYEDTRGPQIFDAEPRTVRRESSYSDKPSKRETEREREREREKEQERERQKKASDALRRAEKAAKEAKEARRAEKKKEREKERKREAVDKKTRDKPYIESYEDELHAKEKKKSSKKHDEKRDRSSHRGEEAMPRMAAPPPPPPAMPEQWTGTATSAASYMVAASYIEARNRSKVYPATRVQPPAAPTPPPAPGQSSPFAPPAEDVRRSSAKPRRGSSGEKKAYKKASHEVLEDPIIVDTSPSAHHAQKTATAAAALSGSPPRRELHRQHTMPISAERFSRPIPTMSRSQTFAGGSSYPEMAADPRGRSRSKLHPQIEESDSEEERARRHRERKAHRSKKHRSPEPRAAEYIQQAYKVESGRTIPLHNSYSRGVDPAAMEGYGGYYSSGGHGIPDTRSSMPMREAGSYSSSPGNHMGGFGKVKTSKAYDYEDVTYSNNYPTYQDEYAAQAY
ncbi:hypothetical protein G7Z17_g5415 [Cylindrodendrum hubeiense]|uniref:J domain-containing protein n=1 Tax=Cylindrodendrum hubeiense TaxID=595255 RepID=A0A9P5LBR9_9HYPO|nr:hypothetical protein G7Z17_g5415 [Cylindrodendrum hubeiense]